MRELARIASREQAFDEGLFLAFLAPAALLYLAVLFPATAFVAGCTVIATTRVAAGIARRPTIALGPLGRLPSGVAIGITSGVVRSLAAPLRLASRSLPIAALPICLLRLRLSGIAWLASVPRWLALQALREGRAITVEVARHALVPAAVWPIEALPHDLLLVLLVAFARLAAKRFDLSGRLQAQCRGPKIARWVGGVAIPLIAAGVDRLSQAIAIAATVLRLELGAGFPVLLQL